jgi:hypothetical protein
MNCHESRPLNSLSRPIIVGGKITMSIPFCVTVMPRLINFVSGHLYLILMAADCSNCRCAKMLQLTVRNNDPWMFFRLFSAGTIFQCGKHSVLSSVVSESQWTEIIRKFRFRRAVCLCPLSPAGNVYSCINWTARPIYFEGHQSLWDQLFVQTINAPCVEVH